MSFEDGRLDLLEQVFGKPSLSPIFQGPEPQDGLKPYYEEHGIRIFWGDCRQILPQLGTFDLVVTSPPYDSLREYGASFDGLDWHTVIRLLSEKITEGVVDDRVAMAVEIVSKEPKEKWLIWSNMNRESEAIFPAGPLCDGMRSTPSRHDDLPEGRNWHGRIAQVLQVVYL